MTLSRMCTRIGECICLYDFFKSYDIVKETKGTTVAYKFKYGFIKKENRILD